MQIVMAILLLVILSQPPQVSWPALTIETESRAQTTQVILLGTGMPYPDPAASGPATAVVVAGRVFLFDAGPGVMRRLKAANLPINGPEALFITHLHSDHTLGYPDRSEERRVGKECRCWLLRAQ